MTSTALIALAAVTVLAGLYLLSPSLPCVLAVPASMLTFRVGGSGHGNNLSLSDVFLFVALLSALPLFSWTRAKALRPLLVLAAVYQGSQLFSVLFHPTRDDIIEWFHEILLVAGAFIVGYTVVERDKAKLALGLFVGADVIVALWSILTFASHGFHAYGVLGGLLQKNLLGVLFAIGVAVCFINPPWVGIRRSMAWTSEVILVVGVISTQSRQSILALIIVILVASLRSSSISARPKTLILAVVPLALVVYATVSSQLSSSGEAQNSIGYRQLWIDQGLALWRTSPLFGVGQRFWLTRQYTLHNEPPNAEVSMLATGGVVGLIGFLVLIVGTLYLLWRMAPVAGMLGFSVLLMHFVEGQFDIFWTGAAGSLPFLVCGMSAAAADALRRAREPAPAGDEEPAPPRHRGGRWRQFAPVAGPVIDPGDG